MANPALKHLFNKVYNRGLFTSLIVKRSVISRINNIYKRNFAIHTSFDDLLNSFGRYRVMLESAPSALMEIKKQYLNQKGLQPAIITECFIAQTLANILGLDYFVDIDESMATIPFQLAGEFLRFEGITGKALPRYVFYNKNNNVALLQYGDSSSIDAIFMKSKKSVRIEIKEEKSKLTEIDINEYDENGKLIINEKFREDNYDYIKFVDLFNSRTDMFTSIGHNFKFANDVAVEEARLMFEKFLVTKNIDMYLMLYHDAIIPVLAKDLFDNVDISESEIRNAGRNDKRVFTPIYLTNLLTSLNAIIVDDLVNIPLTDNQVAAGRNVNRDTRFKLNNLFFVRLENVEFRDGFAIFKMEHIRQLKPTISLHLDASPNEDIIREAFDSINT